jgi:ketosteroid isomerase-like protein
MTAHNKAMLEAANAAITRGDQEGFLAHCTEDTEWTFVGDTALKGKAAVRQWMARAYAEPPVFTVDHMIAEGEFVIATGMIRIQENGADVGYQYCDIWRFRDGKMAGLQAFVIQPKPAP